MRTNDFVNVALSYLVSVALINLLITVLGYAKPGIALAVGVVVGTDVAAWLYKRCSARSSSVNLRLGLGAMLAALCIAESAGLQLLIHWMVYPLATTAIAAAGTLVFPLLMFEGLAGWIGKSREDK